VRKTFCTPLIFCASLACTMLPLRADVITFDSISPPGNAIQTGTVTTQGFNFTSPSFHVIDQPTLCAGGCVDNGSQYLAVAGPDLDSPVGVTSMSGEVFSVSRLDAGKLFLTPGGLGADPNADTLTLLGTLGRGGTISTSLILPAEGSFTTFSLTGFTNLTSLTISGTGGGSTDASWAVDNLVASAVPEPSTLLMLAGCGLFVTIVRRYLAARR
jgi:hypothetical protein